MIPVQDLQNKSFSRTVRGYNPIEVDDYVKFLLAKYEELCRENAELEKRLHHVSGKYEELASDENAIRNAVGQAKKLVESMLSAAEKAADEVVDKARARCDELIENAQIKVEAEEEKALELRLKAAEFKEMLIREFSRYLGEVTATRIPTTEEVRAEFPTREQIRTEVLDDLIAEDIIEEAVLDTARDPSLEEFKRFTRPQGTHLTPEEKEARQNADKRYPGHLTDEILKSNVDEDPGAQNDPPADLPLPVPETEQDEAENALTE